MTPRSVRELRVALAAALAERADDRKARAEALSLLDTAAKDPGPTPSDGEINLLAGRLLEHSNPAAAFTHYFQGATDGIEEAAERARTLLEDADQVVLQSALEQDPQRWAVGYRDTDVWSASLALLAVALLRLAGRIPDAVTALEPGLAEGKTELDVVGPRMVELLLLLDRVDDAVNLLRRIDGADPAELRLASARCAFWSRDFDGALAELGDDDSTAVSVLRAMSLAGLSRAPEALPLLSSGQDPAQPEILRARGVAHLSMGDYPAARVALWNAFSAEPASVESLLLTAQLGLESLGDPAELTPSGDPSPTSLDAIDQARAPLGQLTEQLAGVTSRWLAMQDVARGEDDRYSYFRCELLRARREAAGGHLTVEDLSDTDVLWSTTLLQDGILAELRADALAREGNIEDAVDEYDDAAEEYRDDFLQRALRCASEAVRLEPTLARRAFAALLAHDHSYNLKSDAEASELVEAHHAELQRSIVERGADDPAFPDATWSLAWLRLRRAELASEDFAITRDAATTAFLAAVLDTSDAMLLSTVSSVVSANNLSKTSAFIAARALELAPHDAWVATQAVSAHVNDVPNAAVLNECLREVEDEVDAEWADAIRLYVALVGDDRPGLESLRSRPVADSSWARQDSLYAAALIDGLTVDVRERLDEYRQTAGIVDRIEVSCILGDRSGAETALADEGMRIAVPEEACYARALMRFAFDPSVTAADCLGEVLPLRRSRSDIGWVGHVVLPLVSTTRGGGVTDTALPARIAPLLAERARQLDGQTWQDELREADPLLFAAARIWAGANGDVTVDAIRAAAADLREQRLEPATDLAAKWASQAAVDAAGRHLAAGLAGVVAAGAAPSPDLVSHARSPAWGPALGTGLALLAGVPDAAAVASPDAAEIPQLVQVAITGAATDAERWWRLADHLEASASAAADPSRTEQLRASLLPTLANLVGMTSAPDRLYRAPVAFLLGDDLAADSENMESLVRTLQERIRAANGFVPALSIGIEPLFRDTVRVLVHDSTIAHQRLPTRGKIRLADPIRPGPTLRDPLSGQPVEVQDDGNADSVGWTPTEFAVRQIEAVILANLDLVLQVSDVVRVLQAVDRGLTSEVLSDPSSTVRCLDLFRTAVRSGALLDVSTVRRLAVQAVGVAAVGGDHG